MGYPRLAKPNLSTTTLPAEGFHDTHLSPREGDTVLVVEDSRAIASLLQSNIEALPDVQCELVADMAGATRLLAQYAERFFVAILDLNLPDAPNGEVVDLVQSYDIPVIILTGSVDAEKRQSLFRRNIADYIEKNHLAGVWSAVALVERMRANREHAVLVVDDSAAQRAYLCSLLHNRGYHTVEAADGEEGLAMLKSHEEIRAVITDYNMPKMDGLQMVQQMRTLRSPQDLAIIGVSSATEKGILARFLKSGANDFLHRPFELEELYCRIDQNLDMVRYIHQAWDAANRDFLTHLYNRRYFFKHAQKIHESARQGKYEIVVAMVDADHFKRINDTHGHDVGDEALVAIASTLEKIGDGRGIIARFGGEEFVCIRILKPDEDPVRCMQSLCVAIEEIDLMAPDGSRVPLTVSIGATRNVDESLGEMLKRADEAVYQAKQQGRNRVVVL